MINAARPVKSCILERWAATLLHSTFESARARHARVGEHSHRAEFNESHQHKQRFANDQFRLATVMPALETVTLLTKEYTRLMPPQLGSGVGDPR